MLRRGGFECWPGEQLFDRWDAAKKRHCAVAASEATGYHHAGFAMSAPKIPDRVLPDEPATRPLERFWPYTELTEEPSDEEMARIDPALREAIYGPLNLPF